MVSLALTKDEINALKIILKNKGYNWEEISKHIDDIKDQLWKIHDRLKKKGKSPEEIKAKFTEAYYRICQEFER